MLHKTIKVMPLKEKDEIEFSHLNGINCFAVDDAKVIEIAESEKMFISFILFNKTGRKYEHIDYPNLWAQLDLLDENFELHQRNFMTIKEDGVIIKKNKINLKKFNFRLILRREDKTLDQVLIFVV